MTVYRRPDPIPIRRAPRVEPPRALHAVRAEPDDLHHLVARQIFAAIVSGDFPEGSILPNEHRLSEELGVSRTALREAIKGLASKGLVETRRRRGTQVLERSRWNMLDADLMSWSRRLGMPEPVSERLWQAVAAVLPALAALAAERRGSGAIRRAAAALQQPADAETRLDAFADALLAIARAAGNPFLLSLASTCLGNLLAEDRPFLGRRFAGFDTAALAGLADMVAAGDAVAAESRMRQLLTPARATEGA